MRALKRLYGNLHVVRRKSHKTLEELTGFVQNEITSYGQTQEYQWLHSHVI